MSDEVSVLVEYDDILRETEKAYLFLIGDEEIWVPKSVIRLDKANKKVSLPRWLARKKLSLEDD